MMTGWERLRFLLQVVLPTWAKGILLRRSGVVALAQRWELERKAVGLLQQLRNKYGERPLMVKKPPHAQLVLLSTADVARVLQNTPQPFSASTRAKQAALSHFEPHISLLARGPDRLARREFNDEVLESREPIHHLAVAFLRVVRAEAWLLFRGLHHGDKLTWPAFSDAWNRAARQIVLGVLARDDRVLSEDLAGLRAAANWVFLPSLRRGLRSRYYARLGGHLARAEPGSLAEIVANRRPESNIQAADQATHWLFAFDAGGMATFRALALLAAHPRHAHRVRSDLERWRARKADLPFLRAAFLEAVRLWPTSPIILRETTEATAWGSAILPTGTGIVAYAPFFHRDNERLSYADRFVPDIWIDKDPADALPLIPFSAGPADCPGRHLVALIGSAWLAAMLDHGPLGLAHPMLRPEDGPLPSTLDHFSMRFSLVRHGRDFEAAA